MKKHKVKLKNRRLKHWEIRKYMRKYIIVNRELPTYRLIANSLNISTKLTKNAWERKCCKQCENTGKKSGFNIHEVEKNLIIPEITNNGVEVTFNSRQILDAMAELSRNIETQITVLSDHSLRFTNEVEPDSEDQVELEDD